jgi:hypothetical protein
VGRDRSSPGVFLYVYLGTLGQLGLNLFRGKSHPRILEYVVWGGGLVTLVLALSLMGRMALRLLQAIEELMRRRCETMLEMEDVITTISYE